MNGQEQLSGQEQVPARWNIYKDAVSNSYRMVMWSPPRGHEVPEGGSNAQGRRIYMR